VRQLRDLPIVSLREGVFPTWLVKRPSFLRRLAQSNAQLNASKWELKMPASEYHPTTCHAVCEWVEAQVVVSASSATSPHVCSVARHGRVRAHGGRREGEDACCVR
jgi:hypothetical protein